MKKTLFTVTLGIILSFGGFTQEFKILTTVESVVAGGLGRSRMIESDATGELKETKMKNFFSLAGINFGNIMKNDLMIGDRLSTYIKEGWRIENVTSGVYSAETSTGIFITRYLLRKD